ncbi:MAG TPA: amino acid permease [Longimicrobiales bacterium]|nr:amino acid permease [Longimicrobiales bacterium]
MRLGKKPARLRKELGLLDVYAISTGAMFSSGFFLLPGLAAAQTGPSAPLAYLVAGLFILPAMFSVAELATAMPRAGGAYYFLDRSMGPLVGTVGGLGTWLALVLKSAFALVGMGAYLALYVDIPIEPLAIGLTIAFAALNIFGAKETSGLQRVLVGALLVVMAFFLVQGLAEVATLDAGQLARERMTPFFAFGLTGFMGTVGLVFVSYAGLTKVASVSEEIENPDRNIPLGMILSLITATVVYTLGVLIMIAVLPADQLREDLTPVATAAAAFFDWLPGGTGVLLVVIAAIAAFASTGNAGILSASRYPLAMARDRLVPARYAELGRFHTPTAAIVSTAVIMIVAIVVLDIEAIAKLASAFQLLLFSLLNLAVVIMRESEIEGYDPAYRSPLYPRMQVVGFLAPFWLIAEMGQMAILFTLGLVALTIGWYFHYARPRVHRTGAIFHTFARLGQMRYRGLDAELRDIVMEKGLREEDPFEELVALAPVIDMAGPVTIGGLTTAAAGRLAEALDMSAADLEMRITREFEEGVVPVANGIALLHLRSDLVRMPALLLVRCSRGLDLSASPHAVHGAVVRGVILLLSVRTEAGRHLRLLGHLAALVDDLGFPQAWATARDEDELRATLAHRERSLTLRVGTHPGTETWVGHPLRAVEIPKNALVALVRRAGAEIVPNGSTVFEAGDRVTIIGAPEAIAILAGGAPHRGGGDDEADRRVDSDSEQAEEHEPA